MRVLIQFLPLFIPLIVYVVYATIVRRQTELNGGQAPAWTENTPAIALLWAGVVCMTVGLIVWIMLDSTSPDTVYVPGRYIDGEIVPGVFLPADGAGAADSGAADTGAGGTDAGDTDAGGTGAGTAE